MKLKANDQLHVSSVKADTIQPGEQFSVSDAEGQQLVDRGLATEVGRSTGGVRKAVAPKNKRAAAPRNKAR